MILALQTDSPTTRAWLYPDAASVSSRAKSTLTWESGRDLADQLLAKLDCFLRDHSEAFDSLTGIIVFSGPGSFTSLRIGHSVANALADSLSIPVVGTTGTRWIATGVAQLASTALGVPAMPYYGSDAHISLPKT